MPDTELDYDVALSFAGEDREYVDEVASYLKNQGVPVFYDQYEKANLWGKNLYDHLAEIYSARSKYVVMFISKHYAEKVWPNHERKSAQAKALRQETEFILPARFDDTEIPGLPLTIGYIDLSTMSPREFGQLVEEKLGGSQAVARKSVDARSAQQSFPDWTIRELFIHIDPSILTAGEARGNAIASKVRDELSVGKLKAWGRNDARLSFGKDAPLEEIGKDYWGNGSLEPYFFLAGEDHRWLVHAKPEANLSGPHYRDIHVNKSQVMALWPQPSLALVSCD
jgi:hypothetical protein